MKEHFCVCGRMTQEEYDRALGSWYALGMEGCEEMPHDDAGDAGVAGVAVKVYFTSEETARAAADDLRRIVRRGDTVAVAAVVNEDWNARWRQSMEPAKLAPSWWVAPLWLPPPLGVDDHWIKIEPKMAFGTGHHETTRLAAQAIIACAPSLAGVSLLDIGTGSGVLCFVAAMAGAARCVGIEIDRECRENLAENRLLNSDAVGCAFVVGPVGVLKRGTKFGLIVMNMIHTESAPLLGDCRELLADNGILIWSGILRDENRWAIEAAEAAGFHLKREFIENEWWCGRFGVRVVVAA